MQVNRAFFVLGLAIAALQPVCAFAAAVQTPRLTRIDTSFVPGSGCILSLDPQRRLKVGG
jgi:hypothetical protein